MAEPEVVREAVRKHVAAAWDEARTERTLEGARQKHARRRTQRLALGAGAAVVLAALAAIVVLPASDPKAPAVARKPTSAERSLSFVDGSQAVLLDAAADVVVERALDGAIDVILRAGRARFEIAPNKERTFQVACGDVIVRVLGTGFELERAGERTHVRVLHGRVAVRWPGGSQELGAGEAGWFPKLAPAPIAAAPEAPVEAEEEQPASRERARAVSWRQHAERGEFQEAYRMLERDRDRVSDDVEELLLAADASRLSGHASEAVPYLQRVVDRHPSDPRAPLAAFTLGGVLMNQLGRPREAEAAYARARAMSPSSALSQDALARQVEAAHRASDAAAARALALEYLERYPEGRRVQAVRRFGGLP
jgi:transmembrane sensor